MIGPTNCEMEKCRGRHVDGVRLPNGSYSGILQYDHTDGWNSCPDKQTEDDGLSMGFCNGSGLIKSGAPATEEKDEIIEGCRSSYGQNLAGEPKNDWEGHEEAAVGAVVFDGRHDGKDSSDANEVIQESEWVAWCHSLMEEGDEATEVVIDGWDICVREGIWADVWRGAMGRNCSC